MKPVIFNCPGCHDRVIDWGSRIFPSCLFCGCNLVEARTAAYTRELALKEKQEGCRAVENATITMKVTRAVRPEVNFGETNKRPLFHQYFLEIARAVSRRSTCLRAQVGAVLVKDQQIISTGYNGSIAGMPHCLDVGCDVKNDHCQRTIHAEMNTLIQAAKHGKSVSHATLYCTTAPCWNCFRVLVNADVRAFHFSNPYRLEEDRTEILKVADSTGVRLFQWSAEECHELSSS